MSEPKMTREHAEAEAYKLWGYSSFADWFTTEGDPPTSECVVGYFSYPGMGTERMHKMGSGDSFEAAFRAAGVRLP